MLLSNFTVGRFFLRTASPNIEDVFFSHAVKGSGVDVFSYGYDTWTIVPGETNVIPLDVDLFSQAHCVVRSFNGLLKPLYDDPVKERVALDDLRTGAIFQYGARIYVKVPQDRFFDLYGGYTIETSASERKTLITINDLQAVFYHGNKVVLEYP